MKTKKKSLGRLTRDCIIVFLFAAVFFGGSYIGIRNLQKQENWKLVRAAIIEVESEVIYDEQEQEYEVHEWGAIEFTQEDGSVRQEDFKWVTEGTRDSTVTAGDMRDVIYDPESEEWAFGMLPEKGDYTAIYVMRYVALVVMVGIVLIWIRGYFKNKQTE